MTREEAYRICDELDAMGVEYQLHLHYSGRYMFGRTTPAISLDSEGDLQLASTRAGLTLRTSNLRRDQLGKTAMVFY